MATLTQVATTEDHRLHIDEPYNTEIVVPWTIFSRVLPGLASFWFFWCQCIWWRHFYKSRKVRLEKERIKNTAHSPTGIELQTLEPQIEPTMQETYRRKSRYQSYIHKYLTSDSQASTADLLNNAAVMGSGGRVIRDSASMFDSKLRYSTPEIIGGETYSRTMGLKRVDLDIWLACDTDYLAYHAARSDLLRDQREEVLQYHTTDARVHTACAELLEEVVQHLLKAYPDIFNL
jgi:hypothetical protein